MMDSGLWRVGAAKPVGWGGGGAGVGEGIDWLVGWLVTWLVVVRWGIT